MCADLNSSMLAEHARLAGHLVDWEKACVVTNCSDLHFRLVDTSGFLYLV